MSSSEPIETAVPVTLRSRSRVAVPASHVAIPLQEFIVKVYERCNLACDYCYIYEMADQTWTERPNVMTEDTMRQISHRIAEHVRAHNLDTVDVIFHGGEPLLRGVGFFTFAVDQLRNDLPASTEIRFRVQTNGTLLTEKVLDTMLELDIRVGVSLDGDRTANDKHRKYRDGRSSYDKVLRGLELLALERYQPAFSRVYSTIDVTNDPISTYESVIASNPPFVDFLLPHGNWDAPPPHVYPHRADNRYGIWLSHVFDRWYGATTPQPQVRLFTEIVNLLLGGTSRVETIGLSPAALVAIETDGTIEQVDSLRSAYNGAAQTGMDVFTHTFDEVLQLPAIAFRQLGAAALSATCRSCPIQHVCGGGYLPHRYASANGFDNPSVYCNDLVYLIDHISTRLSRDINQLDESTQSAPSRSDE